ncbi:MAG: phosphonoacetaldehyde hydrolase [Polyangiaceae bacterium]
MDPVHPEHWHRCHAPHPPHARLEAVVFDWAGTTVDHGCLAPVASFIEVFRRRGVPITAAEARAPMGTHKRRHIELLTEEPSIAERWLAVHGKLPTASDVDAMFLEFTPLQMACLEQHADPIEGCVETVQALRARGLKIGSTTGFTREMMEVLLPAARRRGYSPDVTVSATDVPAGRPYPFMCLKNVIDLSVSAVEAVVKVDDTLVGIEEGLNAGMWTVGVVMTGNEIGLTRPELDALAPSVREDLAARAAARMELCGAHYVIDGVADLLPCLEDIEARMSRGEHP